MNLKSNDRNPDKIRDGHRGETRVKMKVALGDRLPQAEELLELPEAGRGLEIWISQILGGTWSSDTLIWDVQLPDFERITSYCFKPPICGDITAAVGN